MLRKIESSEEKAKRDKRRGKIIGIVLLVIMVVSTAGYSFLFSPGSGSGNTNQDGKVIQQGGYWLAEVGGKTLVFSQGPEVLKNVSINGSIVYEYIKDENIYIDSNNSRVYNELSGNLDGYFPRVQGACSQECDRDLPLKNCSQDTIIIYRESDINKIYKKEKCTYIEGSIGSADAFMYKLFKIE